MKPPSTSARSNCFLGCFGCSGKNMQHKDKKINSSSRHRNWISKLYFRSKKTKVKTVPVDQTTVTRKSKSEKPAPVKSSTTWEIQVVEDDAKLNTRWTDSVKNQNRSFRTRRKETKPVTRAVDGLDLPEKKSATILSHSNPLNHLETLPLPDRKKLLQSPTYGNPAGGGDEGRVNNKTTPFNSLVGMSIILVTLVIMMLWGKLCAILCTSAWFFIAPRLIEHAAVVTAEKGRPELDFDSVGYKKKVVLEGLLQRNNRNVVGLL